jgi:hypothetical protein
MALMPRCGLRCARTMRLARSPQPDPSAGDQSSDFLSGASSWSPASPVGESWIAAAVPLSAAEERGVAAGRGARRLRVSGHSIDTIGEG